MTYSFARSELHALLKQLAHSHEQDIPGVMAFDSGQAGPTLGIMAMTHGNEPSGLAALAALLQDDALKRKLQRGRVLFILNNLKGALRYFEEAQDLSYTPDFRYIDCDMNRLPAELSDSDALRAQGLDSHYEIQRARALLPIYRQLDYVLDIHSTSAPTRPMLIEIDPDLPPLSCPGVSVLLRNILPKLSGTPVVSLCSKAKGYVIETGSHESRLALDIAQSIAWQMLRFTEHITQIPEPFQGAKTAQEMEIYSVYKSVIMPNESYALPRIIEAFEALPAGMVLAEGDGAPLRIDRDSYAIMPPPRIKPHHPGSEFLHLATREFTHEPQS